MKNHPVLWLLLPIIFFVKTLLLSAAPWINVGDTGLRADLQLLSDSGQLSIPLATYPLMWASVAPPLSQINIENLNPAQQNAFIRIKQAMKKATKQGHTTKISLFTSTEGKRFSGFEANQYEKNKLTASSEWINQRFSAKLALNRRSDLGNIAGDQSFNFDHSYIAFKLGNWVLDMGAIDQWWGPGFESSLILSNNARPLPAIAIRRNDSRPFATPWLSWIGPWTFSAQMAQLETERYVADAKLWSSRATFKPLKHLELGLAWSYQWAGQGQPDSFNQFVRGLLGRTECVNGAATCSEALQTKLGNQLAGFDARWSDRFGAIPYAVYAQTIGEDSPSPGTLQISDKSYLYGIEAHLPLAQSILVNLEYSDTQANCGARGDTSQDCFYEHSTYRSGYRYYQRSIGSNYDNDAQTFVLTLFSQLKNGDHWQAKFRHLKLNTNNRDRYPNEPSLGNSVSKIAQSVKQIDLHYQFNLTRGKLTLGGLLNQSEIATTSEQSYDFYLRYDYEID